MPAILQDNYSFSPIGFLYTSARWRYEAPRQAEFSESSARIELKPGLGFEDALCDINGFSRIWVIFVFHLNSTWRPKVSPPYAPEHRKYGVFATRSPHRPNPIGMSCIELAGVEGLTIYLKHCDILDRTPILDIKPYIPVADSFPEAKAGWRDELKLKEWHLDFTQKSELQTAWILSKTGLDLRNFCQVQLKYNPFDTEKKRIHAIGDNLWKIHCRTWCVCYSADETQSRIQIRCVCSNYSPDDLIPDAPDIYADKDIHRAFNEVSSWK